MYRWVNFTWWACHNQHPDQVTEQDERSPSAPSQSLLLLRAPLPWLSTRVDYPSLLMSLIEMSPAAWVLHVWLAVLLSIISVAFLSMFVACLFPWCECIAFINSTVDGHLSCFQFWLWGMVLLWTLLYRPWMYTKHILSPCNYIASPFWTFLVAQLVKNPSAIQETPVRFLSQEDPLEKT